MGGWILLHLLARGEDPKQIRIVDLRRTIRRDLLASAPAEVELIQTDISKRDQVRAAFLKAWPTDIADRPLTVFHTAAIIR